MKFLSGRLVRILFVAAVLSAPACGTKVSRVDVKEQKDLSGRWNDTDSRLVSEEVIKDVMSAAWLERFQPKKPGGVPTVIVGTIRNRSSEHINTQTFSKDLERAWVNSGRVDVVASKDERKEIRDERTDQQYGFTAQNQADHAEKGADYMLQGVINSITDQAEGERVVFYQINLELINLSTNQKVWIGEKKIKKYIERSKAKF
ncbi:MAG: penicillin-binding protein activator LpoB [Deltaproteobacteria bacterium]|nr:penicillin-binding protein activator LpoB [Deltaproteobacteria bacterium]